MNTRPLVIALLSSLVAVPVLAQPSSTPPAPPSSAPPAPPPPSVQAPDPGEPAVEAGVVEDANSGRTWMSPTALTPPAGTFSLHDHELLVIGGSFAFSDNFVASLSTLFPIVEDMPLVLLSTFKVKVADSGRLKVAGHASVNYFSEQDESFGTALLGGVATYCLDPDCHSLLNGYIGAGFALADVEQSSVPFIFSGAWVQRLNQHIKLVLEADSAFVAGEVNDISDGFLAWYGLRFTGRNVGVDLGAAKPICDDCDIDDLPLGLPWVSFTYRNF